MAKIWQSISLESIKRRIFDFEDYFFEKKYGLELGGVVINSDLSSDNQLSISHATGYHAVWCRNLRELISEANKTGYSFDNFIDIGSGKGKACFYAHSKQRFKSIIGVEFSKPLVDIANKNKSKILEDKSLNPPNTSNVIFLNIDATEFLLPKENNLIFMFNPFDDVVLEQFISNNINHFKRRAQS